MTTKPFIYYKLTESSWDQNSLHGHKFS